MIDAVLFDMDGLLIDSEPLWQSAEIEVFGALGLHLERADCLRTRGRRLDEVVAYWYREAPWQGPSQSEVRDRIVEGVIARVETRGAAKPGVEHALAFVQRRGLPLALASSSPYRIIGAVLDRLEIREAFRVVHSAQDEPRGKPDPGIFLSAARKLGVAPERCLVFEDSPGGVEAARAAGMRCIAVPDAGTLGPAELPAERARLAEVADLVIDSLAEVDAGCWREVSVAAPPVTAARRDRERHRRAPEAD
ncbi:MAG: hexitol phosphatase HxpB [Myxococcota bacterium]|nr:hexitol phosphatase HxpB [Myxococcota bacterium]